MGPVIRRVRRIFERASRSPSPLKFAGSFKGLRAEIVAAFPIPQGKRPHVFGRA
jgi:hypothetical protein